MTTLNLQVAAGGDDSRVFNATWNNTSSFQPAGGDQSTNVYESQSRFPNVTIPAGATIDSAIITFTANGSNGTGILTKQGFEDVDDAGQIANLGDFNTRKASLSTPVDWDFSTVWVTNTEYSTPELDGSLQGVIDRPGWASGQALNCFHIDDGTTPGSSNWRSGYSYNGSTTQAVKLDIDYTDGAEFVGPFPSAGGQGGPQPSRRPADIIAA